jgi:hypothetical protein
MHASFCPRSKQPDQEGTALATERTLPHPSPLPLGEGATSPASRPPERPGSTTRFWTAVAERSGDTALASREAEHASPTSSPNGAIHTSPGHRPGWLRRDDKALKGRPIDVAAPQIARPFRAGFHLVAQPRASLRFALGWYEAAPLGLNTAPEASLPASRPPEPLGFTTHGGDSPHA